MDDVRQFGDCRKYELFNRDIVDLRDLRDLGLGAQLVAFNRSLSLQEDLARVVEADILPRLMLAHRTEALAPAADVLPDADQVLAFATLILTPGRDDLEARITELLASGLPLDSLLLDLLAPTARHLGKLWEEDLCDFVEVTRAMGRLQSILHEITRRVGTEPKARADTRRILLLPCPGESHSFGLTMVERFFQEAGWEVVCMVAQPADVLTDQVRDGWFDVVGLSLACEVLLPTMTDAIASVRRHSRNPAIRVMVGGPAFALYPGGVGQVGADACAADARQAPDIAEGLLDLAAGPC